MNIIFAALSLILNYFGLKLAVAVYKGFPTKRPFPIRRPLFTRRPLFCVPCDPYVPVLFGDIAWRHFWPVRAWDSWPSPLILKVGNAGKVPAPPSLLPIVFIYII